MRAWYDAKSTKSVIAKGSAVESITLAEAKERLEELIERASRGEDVCIKDPKHGSVRLMPAPAQSHPKPIPGLMKGKVHISDDELLAPLTEEELALLSGETSP